MLMVGYFGGHGLTVAGLLLLAAAVGFILCALVGEQLDEIAKNDLAEVDEKAHAARGVVAQFISKEELALEAKIHATRVKVLGDVDALLGKFLGSVHPARTAVSTMLSQAKVEAIAVPVLTGVPPAPAATVAAPIPPPAAP